MIHSLYHWFILTTHPFIWPFMYSLILWFIFQCIKQFIRSSIHKIINLFSNSSKSLNKILKISAKTLQHIFLISRNKISNCFRRISQPTTLEFQIEYQKREEKVRLPREPCNYPFFILLQIFLSISKFCSMSNLSTSFWWKIRFDEDDENTWERLKKKIIIFSLFFSFIYLQFFFLFASFDEDEKRHI